MAEERKFTANSDTAKNHLLHAVINQLEADFGDNDFDAMDELITMLMKNKDNHEILYAYLSDTAQKNWLENKTNCDRFQDEIIPTVRIVNVKYHGK